MSKMRWHNLQAWVGPNKPYSAGFIPSEHCTETTTKAGLAKVRADIAAQRTASQHQSPHMSYNISGLLAQEILQRNVAAWVSEPRRNQQRNHSAHRQNGAQTKWWDITNCYCQPLSFEGICYTALEWYSSKKKYIEAFIYLTVVSDPVKENLIQS